MFLKRSAPLLFVILVLSSCEVFTFTLRSKKNIRKEKPSVVLLEAIVDYRKEFNTWPFSKEEFMMKGKKYRDAFEGFPYMYTNFKVIDNNTMTFYFNDHRRDLQNFKETQKIDLNSYGGHVKFFKERENFIWKIKMN